MKILFYDMGSYTYQDIVFFLEKMGHTCVTVYYHFPDKYEDDFFCKRFSSYLKEGHFDVVMSVNFFPLVAELCNIHHIKYLSWCYDSPLEERLQDYFSYETNYIFLFDSMEAARYQARGYEQVYHLPLAVNTDRMNQAAKNQKQFAASPAQVSFVGQLYDSPLSILLASAEPYVRGYIEGILQAQLRIYGYYFIDELLKEEILEQINRSLQNTGSIQTCLTPTGLSYAIAALITQLERSFLLNEMSELYTTHFYTTKPCNLNPNVKLCGPLKYHTEMPAVFRYSKINLCPTLKSIQSGIPLRALDILGSGGVLLSNYQPELAEYFIDGEDCLLYSSLEEAVDKAGFYIAHEELREKICLNGYQKTQTYFDYPSRIKKMFALAQLD